MTTVVPFCYEPIARDAGLHRLILRPPGPALSNQIWTQVHEAVQPILARIDELARRRVPDLQATPGSTQGRQFRLFTYRTFSRAADHNVDPVVVGLTFNAGRLDEEPVVVNADISGEETGDPVLSLGTRSVEPDDAAVLRASRELARELSDAYERVAEALLGPGRTRD